MRQELFLREIKKNIKYIIQYFSQISSLNKGKYVHILIVQCVSITTLPAYNYIYIYVTKVT